MKFNISSSLMQTSELQKTSPGSAEELDSCCINTLRFLSVDAVQKANSGHPGLPLGAAPMAYVLWTRFLNHNPSLPNWFKRDRFVLSAGHGSMLLYSLLHLSGYELPLNEIKKFRQWGSIAAGHPERGLTPGVETTTGPLGQGFANGVGMAMAEKYMSARFNQKNFEIAGNYTYGIVSDGDLMEGISAEAASLAGHLQLGKLIYLYDNNHITLAASTYVSFTEDVAKRFEAYGWQTIVVENGNDITAIEQAIHAAREESTKPSLILVRTHIGFGSPKQDSFEAHGSPLGPEAVKQTKEKLNWPITPEFYIPEAASEHFKKSADKGRIAEKQWTAQFENYKKAYPDLAQELEQYSFGELPSGWDTGIPVFPADAKGMATRVASGKIMQAFFKKLPCFIGGSADLDTSTHTELKDAGNFGPPVTANTDMQGSAGGGWSYAGRNIHFGIREHAMGGICNGMAAYGGIRPFCATFLVFSDYMRPSIRLACIMGLHVTYVFTHDSVGLGEDGTTHQPVEQLLSLRAMPDLTVIRPADANETATAWRCAILSKKKPVALILSRQDLPTLDRNKYAKADGLYYGAYILLDEEKPEIILIASGSEVKLITEAAELLKKENIRVRLVSMPSWDLFEAQDEKYRNTIFPPAITCRLAVEAGLTLGWERYTGSREGIIGIDHFGSSAPGDLMMRECGLSAKHVFEKALLLLKKKAE
jgi:transketolase